MVNTRNVSLSKSKGGLPLFNVEKHEKTMPPIATKNVAILQRGKGNLYFIAFVTNCHVIRGAPSTFIIFDCVRQHPRQSYQICIFTKNLEG